MKKVNLKCVVNWTIIGLACIVLIWGIVAASLNLAYNNAANYVTAAGTTYRYNKDGKEIVTTTVSETEEYRAVQSFESENITQYEHYKRVAKYNKIVMDKAKEKLDADNTDANKLAYNKAVANYKQALTNMHNKGITNFTSSASVFFGTYFPVIIFLGIALLVNQKVEYKIEFKKGNKE